jgi:sugar O-acyltransferase (sialic acid O-acetyltransferase NeuD family)
VDAPFRRLLIVGAGGSGREIAWLARDVLGDAVELVFAVEPQYFVDASVDDIPVRLLDATIADGDTRYVIAIGDAAARRRIDAVCTAIGLVPTTLVHPRVAHSSRVVFGPGSVVCAGSVLTTDIVLGRHVHVDIGCTISHDVTVGDYATLSPGVHIAGHVQVGSGAFFGTGANVINGKAGARLQIGNDAVIGAGACVIDLVEAGACVMGVPAKPRRSPT